MFRFSSTSNQRLATCDERLQEIANKVMELQLFDFGISCGHRTEAEQNKLFDEGKSKLKWPMSKHNGFPSKAFDFVLYVNGKIDWNDSEAWYMAVGVFRGVAAALGYKIRCGADWDGDFTKKDQTFNDLPHIEILD